MKGEKVFKKRTKVRLRSGISLIEAMNAIAILAIAVIGASAYKFCATMDAQKAETYITSARIGHMLCESWCGLQGAENYDPATHLGSGLAITQSDGPDAPPGFTSIGTYELLLNDVVYHINMSWKNVNTDLRALNVVLVWPQRVHGQSEIEQADKSFELTTYILN